MNTTFLYSQNKTLLLCISSWGWGSIQSMAHTLLNSQRKKTRYLCCSLKMAKITFFFKLFLKLLTLLFFHRNIVRSYSDIQVWFFCTFSPSFLNTVTLADNQKKHFKWRSHGSISGRSGGMQTLTELMNCSYTIETLLSIYIKCSI